MSVLNIKENTWNEFINQVDTGEEISGGIDGNANIATRQLAENILFIKRKMYELAQNKDVTLSESQKTEFTNIINDRIDAVKNLMSEYKDLTDSEIKQVIDMIQDEVNVSLEHIELAVKDNATKSDELSEKIDNEISEAMDNFQEAINSIEASDQAVEETIRTVLGARYEDGKSPLEMTLALLLQEETVRAEKDLAQAKRISILQSSIGGEYEAFKTWKYYEDPEDWVGGIYHPEEYSLKVLNSELVSPSIDVDGGKFNHVKLRIKRVGEPTWKGKILWNGRSDTEFKDIEEPLDWNDGKFITLNIDMGTEWRKSTINTIYFQLTDNADANNYFIIDWVSIGRNTPGISTAQIATIENTITELDSAVAERLTSIESELVIPGVGAGEGSYNEWIASTIGPDGAQTKKLETLESKWEGAEGFASVVDIIDNLETKTDATQAAAISNNTITAKFGNLTEDDLTPIVDSYGEYVDKVDIVADAEKATAEKLEGLTVEYNKSSVDFNERLTVQAEENESTAALVTSLTARTEGVEGSISSIEKVITNADGTGLVQRMDNLELDIDGEDGINAKITSLDKIVSDNNTTAVKRLNALDLAGKDFESSITSLESIVDLENENSLITSRFNSIESSVGENSGSIDSLERIVDMGNENSVIVTKFNDLNAKTDSAIGSITELEEVMVGPNNSIVTQISNLDGRTAATEGSISELQETTNTLTTSITENNREISSKFNIIEDIEIVPGYSSIPEYYKNRWGDILKRRVFDNEEDLRNYKPDLNGTDLGKSKEIKTASDLGIDTHTGNVYIETSVPSTDVLISEMVEDEDGNVIEPAVYEYTIDNAKNVEQTVYTDTGRVFTRNSTGNDTWSTWFEVIDTSAYTELLKVAKAILYGTAANTNSVISVKEKTYADMETAMSEIVTSIESDIDGNTSSIDTITKTYATKDYVGGEISNEINNKFKTVDGVVTGSLALELKKAWSDDFSSTSEKLENFVADYDGNIADVIDSVKAYADSDSASAQKLDALTVGFGNKSLSDFESEIKLYADEESASAEKLDSLSAEYESNKTGVDSSIKSLADENVAQTERMDNLYAGIGVNSAAITSEALARTTEDEAIVKSVNVLSTRTDNAESRISKAETAISNAEGSIVTAREELTSSYTTAINQASSASATDAQEKADAAKSAAEAYATAEAKAKADAALINANSTAQEKANAAESAAKAAAALDAKKKADAALAAAKTHTDNVVKDLKTIVDSKATISRVDEVENNANQALATAKTELTGSYTAAIDSIEVGGRNYVLNSHVESSNSTRLRHSVSDDILKLSGETITISADVRTDDSTTSGSVYIMQLPSDYVAHGARFQNITKEWKRQSVVLTVNEGIENLSNLTVTLAVNTSDVSVKNWKVEKGNKATDWTPAPEDVTDYIDASVGDLKTIVDSKATISRVDQVENNANQALASAKTELTGSYTTAIATAKAANILDAKNKADAALSAAKTDAQEKADAAKSAAQTYAAAEAKAKAASALITANSTAQEKANAAESAAKAAAALDAKKKADAALASAKLDATAKANEAERLAKDHADTKIAELKTIVDSKATITSVEKVVNDANQALAESKKDMSADFSKNIGIVQDNVDNIKIGGVNILIDSIALETVWPQNNYNNNGFATKRITSESSNVYKYFTGTVGTELTQQFEIGTDYVFSCDVYVNGDISSIRAGLRTIPATSGNAFYDYQDVPVKNQWYRLTQKMNFSSVSDGYLFLLGLGGNTADSANYAEFRNFKIEKGNISTAWSITPEEIDAYIEKVDKKEINTVNNILNGDFATKGLDKWTNSGGVTYSAFEGRNTAKLGTSKGIYQVINLQEPSIMTVTVTAYSPDDTTEIRFGFLNDGDGNSLNMTMMQGWASYRFTTASKISSDAILHIYSKGKPYYVTDVMAVIGNSNVNYSKAPADYLEYTDKKITDISTIVDSKASNDSVELIVGDINRSIGLVSDRLTASYSVSDTRNDNNTPDWYRLNYPRQTTKEFKSLSVIGITGQGAYGLLETTISYRDWSGGPAYQMAYPTNDTVWKRVGTGTTWGEWVQQENTVGSAAKVAALKKELDSRISSTEADIKDLKLVSASNTKAVATARTDLTASMYKADNYLVDGTVPVSNANYLMKQYELTRAFTVGDTYRVTLSGLLGADRTDFRIYNERGSSLLTPLTTEESGVYFGFFKAPAGITGIRVYQFTNSKTNASTINSLEIVRDYDYLERKKLGGTIQDVKTVTATADGIKAEAKVLSEVGGKISGWKNLNTGATSSFDILADNFSIGNSSVSKKPFSISGNDITFNGKVSFNSVTDTAVIDKAVNDINNLEIGGRNLIKSTDEIYSWVGVHNVTNTTGALVYIAPPFENAIYQIEARAISESAVGSEFGFQWNSALQGNSIILSKDWQRASVRVNTLIGNIGLRLKGSAGIIETRFIKAENGNKITDWSPAPEDVDTAIKVVADDLSDLDTAIADFKNVSKESFEDGIITKAESLAIKTHKNQLKVEKEEVDEKYSTIYSSAYLNGATKTNLQSAKTDLNNKYTDLVNYITSIISSGSVTKAQSTTVDTKFTAYSAALKLLSKRFEEANKLIIDNAKKAADDHTNNVKSELLSDIDGVRGQGGLVLLNQPDFSAASYNSSGGLGITIEVDEDVRLHHTTVYPQSGGLDITISLTGSNGFTTQSITRNLPDADKGNRVELGFLLKKEHSPYNLIRSGSNALLRNRNTSTTFPYDNGTIRITNATNNNDFYYYFYDITATGLGVDGINPSNVKNVDVEYILSSSSSTVQPYPTSASWTTNPPTWVNDKFMWSRTVTYDGFGEVITRTNPVNISGAKGDSGKDGTDGANGATGADGQSVEKIVEEYNATTTKTKPSSGWSTTPPDWTPEKPYLWTRSKITYKRSNGTTYTEEVGEYLDTSWEAVNGIEIGGRNLLSLNENNWEPGWWSISNGLSSGSASHFRSKDDYKILVKPNTQYTANATQRHVYLEYTSDGVYTDISHRVTEPYTFTTSAATNYLRIYALDPTSPLPNWDVFKSYAFKLERGNKATDWTPAPEDVETAINDVKTSVTDITSDGKITPNEKRDLLRVKDEIVSTHTELLKSVSTVPGATTPSTYTTAYNNVTNILTAAAASPTIISNITASERTSLNDILSVYFNERAKLNDLVVTKTKAYAESQSTQAKEDAIDDAKVKDTRDDNESPSWYYTNYAKKTAKEFKRRSAIDLTAGTGTYCYLETQVKWSDSSGGRVNQTVYTDDSRIFTRNGSESTWTTWVESETTTGATTKANNALADAKTDATAKANAAKAAAQTYALTQAEAKQVLAQTYADGKVTAEESARIADVNAKLAAAKADATAKANAAAAEAKNHADLNDKVIVIDSITKKFLNPASFTEYASSVTGYLIIETPITASRMVKLNIGGYNYQGGKSNLDISIGYYFNGSFHQYDYADMGTYPVENVRLGVKNSKSVVIIGNANSTWSYPKIEVIQAIIGHQTPPDSWKDGWTIRYSNSITDIASVVTINNNNSTSVKSLQDNVYVPGTTEINGGNIKTGTITAVSGAIADLAVTTAKIDNAAITSAKIGDLAVDTAQIANGAIQTAKIGDLAVDTAQIANGAIQTAKIGDLAVDTLQIAGNAVTVPLSVYTAGEINVARETTVQTITAPDIDGFKVVNASATYELARSRGGSTVSIFAGIKVDGTDKIKTMIGRFESSTGYGTINLTTVLPETQYGNITFFCIVSGGVGGVANRQINLIITRR